MVATAGRTRAGGRNTGIEDALARSDALRFLAAGLRDPDGPTACALELDALLETCRELGLAVDAGERAALAEIVDGPTRAAGHRRLFGHTVAHGCPPYETEYGRRHVFGQAQDLADIAGFYAAFGLQPAAMGERVDHLACQLEFVSILALKEAVALAAGQTQQLDLCRTAEASFLNEHLGRWLPALAGMAVRRAPGTGHAVLLDLANRLVMRRAAELRVEPDQLAPDDLQPVEGEPDGFMFECGEPDPDTAIPG